MYIKIYTKSQLVLLRSVNRLFRKKYRLPQEILNRVEAILMVKDLGEHGFVAVLLDPVENDMTGMQSCFVQSMSRTEFFGAEYASRNRVKA